MSVSVVSSNLVDASVLHHQHVGSPPHRQCLTPFGLRSTEDMELEQPYLRVHRTMPASTLARFLADRLRDAGHGADKVLLMCDGGLLDPEEQMGSVIEQRWRAVPASGQLLTIQYSVEPRCAAE